MFFLFASADLVASGQSSWISQQWEAARIKLRQSDEKEAVLIIDEIQKIGYWSEAVKREWDSDCTKAISQSGSARLIPAVTAARIDGRCRSWDDCILYRFACSYRRRAVILIGQIWAVSRLVWECREKIPGYWQSQLELKVSGGFMPRCAWHVVVSCNKPIQCNGLDQWELQNFILNPIGCCKIFKLRIWQARNQLFEKMSISTYIWPCLRLMKSHLYGCTAKSKPLQCPNMRGLKLDICCVVINSRYEQGKTN